MLDERLGNLPNTPIMNPIIRTTEMRRRKFCTKMLESDSFYFGL